MITLVKLIQELNGSDLRSCRTVPRFFFRVFGIFEESLNYEWSVLLLVHRAWRKKKTSRKKGPRERRISGPFFLHRLLAVTLGGLSERRTTRRLGFRRLPCLMYCFFVTKFINGQKLIKQTNKHCMLVFLCYSPVLQTRSPMRSC